MATHEELEWEPQPGIPAPLPQDEKIVWQGTPSWWALAISAFHVRKVALYFSFLVGLQVYDAYQVGFDQEAVMAGPALTLLLSLAGLSILLSLAYLSAVSTIFTLTNKRILIRYGIALTLTLNLPFSQIKAANLKLWKGKTGDIALDVTPPKRLSWIVLWPYARPWKLKNPQPLLRALPDADVVAAQIARVVQEQSNLSVSVGTQKPSSGPKKTVNTPTNTVEGAV